MKTTDYDTAVLIKCLCKSMTTDLTCKLNREKTERKSGDFHMLKQYLFITSKEVGKN